MKLCLMIRVFEKIKQTKKVAEFDHLKNLINPPF